jgi:hypothetical protein
MKRVTKVGEVRRKAQGDFEIIVEYMYVDTTEDSFEKGEIGKTQTNFEEKNVGSFSSFSAIFSFLNKNYGLSDDPKDWEIIDDGLISTGRLEDGQGVEILEGDRDYERWRKGEINLWSTYYYLRIKFATSYIPDESAIRELINK